MADAQEPSPPPQGTRVKVESPPQGQVVPLTFVNHVTASGTDNELYLTLFQVSPPVVVAEKDLAGITSVPANFLARLVLTWPQAVQVWELLGTKIQERAAREQVLQKAQAAPPEQGDK